ncbi:MAG: aminopeptidase P N-terminal domain-containing protein [Sphingobacteriales bacterium]|jgi:Xaa-Pro aminopeptidase|nr:aminopeptidase P N-terminal domain-containing protein [Sphingobacteriales bacterium]MBP9141893.1 aminopeptidase P N-terminal domain-containing protein [Chitinophagales bacterium]MDA0198815.1 aminopeptidase P N-terminal domain-containing protein [Bacteroidota bacterium]MBK7527612.1 aminopeptidase P N-terminal domain-containing protein [Sphingobacteriales bacterium]MBK8678040.1 aminopeptidase P N-terminal domain-containing protein [Sphingobacteriales bacterium]
MKKYHAIAAELFVENRKRLAAQLAPNSVAIFNSNDEWPRSADGFHLFRQNADLFYLSGIDQEQTTLLLFPDHPDENLREVLFIRDTNEHIAVWEGHKYTIEEAQAQSGIKTIFWASQLDAHLPSFMYVAQNCYLNTNEHLRMRTPIADKDLRFAQQLCQQYPLHNFKRLAPIMHHLRSIKTDAELACMREAINITRSAFLRVLKFVKPGVTEYEIEAEIMHEYLKNRATGPAYSSIIASGGNSCVLHYVANNQVCKDGDILLMDFGAEYANYAADLTRTIPVNGRFTARQRAVYEAVLRVMEQAKSMLVPGNYLSDYEKDVGKIMESELIGLGLLSKDEVAKQNPDRPLYKKYYMHGTSHFLGLDVHDVGHKYNPIQAGMVFTCEPGIYIREEGIGIRLENDILVTDHGPVDMMQFVPLHPDEIEDLMN